jgi:NADH-quinone oxidoreductase subunit C
VSDEPLDAEAEAAKAAAAEAARARAEAAAQAKAAQAAAEAAKPAWERDPVVPQWSDAAGEPLLEALRAAHGEAIAGARSFAGDLVVQVRREAIAAVAASLKHDHGYRYLVDVCGADYPKREPRFEVVYHLYSHDANRRVRLKVTTDEATPVPSLCAVFRAANWPEREVYDMYGVRFAGHPDLTRILLWEGFNGYPLRKDFPVEGIDTGVAIYPEYYAEGTGPINKAGTGWLVKDAPAGDQEGEPEE